MSLPRNPVRSALLVICGSLVILALVGVLGAVTACSGTQGRNGGTTAQSAPSKVNVTIKDLRWIPKTAHVRVGGTVTWTNEDTTAHTSTAADFNSDTPTASPPGAWNSPILNPGVSWSHRFDKAGRFPYACSIHSYIKGTVVVTP